VREEWARTADDVLWRRSKCGLGLDDAGKARVAAAVAAAVATEVAAAKVAAAAAVAAAGVAA
jgi:glycerol-3-phosphate dehydrogenase